MHKMKMKLLLVIHILIVKEHILMNQEKEKIKNLNKFLGQKKLYLNTFLHILICNHKIYYKII